MTVVSVGEKIVYDGLADDADFGCALNVGFGEHFAVFHVQLTDFEILGAYAAHGSGIVVVAGNELSAGGYVGADGCQEVGFVAQ